MADDLGALVAKLAADVTDLKKGLQQGRQEFTSFQNLIETGAAKIRSVLAFAGISLGLYALASEVKAFGASILETGQKSEVLRGAMYAIGQYYNISSAALDLYVNKLTQMGVSQENALQSVNNFLKTGLSVDLLPQLAAAAKDLAPSMAMPFNEAFEAIIQSVTKGTPKALAELTPGIKQAIQAASSETKKMMDSTIMSGTERSQVMVDFVLAAAAKLQGAGDSMAGTYLKQINDYKKAVREVKEALFEIVKPISMAITGSEIKSWQDLYVWVVQNKTALKETAQGIADFIRSFTSTAKAIGAFILQHKELIKILLEVYLLSKAAGWFLGIFEGVSLATAGVVGLSAKLAILRASLSVPWALVIAVSVIGLYEAATAIKAVVKETPSVGTSMLLGEAEGTLSSKQQAALRAEGQAQDEAAAAKALREKYKGKGRGEVSAFGGEFKPEKSEAEAKAEADAAAKLAALENKLPPKSAKGGGATEDILGEYLRLQEQLRQADIQTAQSSLDVLKSTNDRKKAELEKNLADGLIDGQAYYASLQELQKTETNAALKLIDIKKQAQIKAHTDALADLARQDLSSEVSEYRRKIIEAQNTMALAQLAAEAARTKLDGEVKVTNELKRQVELRKQYADTTESLNIDTAQLLGAISEQEATLMKLNLEWKNNKEAALKAGLSPSDLFFTAGEKNLEAKKADTLYGGYASQITQGISSLVDVLTSGGQDLQKAANSMFKGLFNEAMKPGLDQLKHLLVSGFKSLFGEAGGSIASAVMGVIGLVGMMLTSSKTKSSWSASSITSSVTSHEAVRGIIAGETSISIAEIGTSLEDALVDTNSILNQIETNTRGGSSGGGGGGGGSFDIRVTIQGIQEQVNAAIEQYFRDYLMTGARG